MSVPTASEIITTRHIRDYIQFGAARPTNGMHYYGQDAQYMIVDSITIPETGTVAPVWTPDPNNTSGRYRLVARTIAAPGSLPKATVTLLERHGSVPRQLARFGLLNLYENVGMCKDPSDFLQGWSDGVLIYSYGITETKTPGKRGSWQTDDRVEDKVALTLESIYPIGAMGLGEKYTPNFEVLDVTYGSFIRDGSCGVQDDGTNTIYAIIKHTAVSPAAAAFLAYSVDGGKTWATSAITGIGIAVDPDKVRVMGDYLVVTSSSENAYYINKYNPDTFAPAVTWTKVTTGIVSGKGPTDMWVKNNREAYLCGLGGYLYKCIDPTAGLTVLDAGVAATTDLIRIDGLDNEIVAVGKTNTILISTNQGQTWAAPATSAALADVQAVAVVGQGLVWVGDSAGVVKYTQNNGASAWSTQTGLTGLTNVKDIRFATKEVGHIAGVVTSLGALWTTWNGGNAWTNTNPRLMSALTMQSVNSIAVPNVAASDPEVASDNIALCGLGDTGVTGAVTLGAVARL